MKKYKIIVLFAIIGVLVSCQKNEEPVNLTPKQINLTAKAPQVISSSNAFGIDLFTKVALEEEGNIMLSPLSASAALTMVLNGCNETTFTQLKATLNYPENLTIGEINVAYKSLVNQLLNADPRVKLAIANAIFYRNNFSIKPPFLDTLSTAFGAHIEGLNFTLPSAITTINCWASDNTYGKIPEVISEISSDAVMFLMNALYFKGNWSSQFESSLTSQKPFYLSNGEIVNVSTMQGEVITKQAWGSNYTALELPYGQTNFTMVIIVPTGNLSSFYESFNGSLWNEISQSIDSQTEYRGLEVILPKFSFSFEKIMNNQLQSMGMVDAFIPFTANFSGITDESIFISFVKQNTFIEVNEEGTEAAAVTTIGFEVTSLPQSFEVNKPFIFVIRERTTNTMLFIGKVENPLN
jgi:serpin B